MSIGTFRVTEAIPAWKTVLDISELVPQDSWMLVGGLMTQVHAGLAGMRSRATDDVDMLVDVLASARNIGVLCETSTGRFAPCGVRSPYAPLVFNFVHSAPDSPAARP